MQLWHRMLVPSHAAVPVCCVPGPTQAHMQCTSWARTWPQWNEQDGALHQRSILQRLAGVGWHGTGQRELQASHQRLGTWPKRMQHPAHGANAERVRSCRPSANKPFVAGVGHARTVPGANHKLPFKVAAPKPSQLPIQVKAGIA